MWSRPSASEAVRSLIQVFSSEAVNTGRAYFRSQPEFNLKLKLSEKKRREMVIARDVRRNLLGRRRTHLPPQAWRVCGRGGRVVHVAVTSTDRLQRNVSLNTYRDIRGLPEHV